MKKIISMIAIFAMTMFMAVAQPAQHVQKATLFENTSVTLLGGVTTTGQMVSVPAPFFWDGTKAVVNGFRPMMGLEFTKYVTPAVGFSVEGLGFVNTTTSATFFDESAVLGNVKFNVLNGLGGYKGYPRRVELVLVGGLGWGHDYTGNNQTVSSQPVEDYELVVGVDPYNSNSVLFTDRNYVVYNTALELNVNLGEARAWQINVRPGVMWFNKRNAEFQSLPTWKDDARVNLQLGVTYKFGSRSKKSHNFVNCPYAVTQAEFDALLAKYNELAGREPEVKEVVKETVKTETVTKEVVTYLGGNTYITFPIGSAVLSAAERAKVEEFAKGLSEDTNVLIVGSADTATGTEAYNLKLAQKRADVVRSVLVDDLKVKADGVNTEVKLDAGSTVDTSRSAVLVVRVVDAD